MTTEAAHYNTRNYNSDTYTDAQLAKWDALRAEAQRTMDKYGYDSDEATAARHAQWDWEDGQ